MSFLERRAGAGLHAHEREVTSRRRTDGTAASGRLHRLAVVAEDGNRVGPLATMLGVQYCGSRPGPGRPGRPRCCGRSRPSLSDGSPLRRRPVHERAAAVGGGRVEHAQARARLGAHEVAHACMMLRRRTGARSRPASPRGPSGRYPAVNSTTPSHAPLSAARGSQPRPGAAAATASANHVPRAANRRRTLSVQRIIETPRHGAMFPVEARERGGRLHDATLALDEPRHKALDRSRVLRHDLASSSDGHAEGALEEAHDLETPVEVHHPDRAWKPSPSGRRHPARRSCSLLNSRTRVSCLMGPVILSSVLR